MGTSPNRNVKELLARTRCWFHWLPPITAARVPRWPHPSLEPDVSQTPSRVHFFITERIRAAFNATTSGSWRCSKSCFDQLTLEGLHLHNRLISKDQILLGRTNSQLQLEIAKVIQECPMIACATLIGNITIWKTQVFKIAHNSFQTCKLHSHS